MKIVKTEGIPPQILRAMYAKMNDYRDQKKEYLSRHKVDHEFSVTTLAKSPRENQLVLRHWSEIEVEAMDLYYTLMGSVMHSILEKFPNDGDKVEHRFGKTFKVDNITVHVHGMGDVINDERDVFFNSEEGGVIEDWKYVSMAAMNYSKDDYIQQLNFLRILMGQDRHKIKTLRNNYLFRDWRSSDVRRGKSPEPLFCRSVVQPLWTDEHCAAKLKDKILKHIGAIGVPDDELPDCTKEELWFSKSGFRVRAKTKKNEWSKLSAGWAETEKEALEIVERKQIKTEWRLEPTTGSPKKCAFCYARPFCNQHKKFFVTEEHDDEVEL